MIRDEQELQVTLDRIHFFQKHVSELRKAERNPTNYRAAAGGFLAEIDRMNLEVREFLSLLPEELKETA